LRTFGISAASDNFTGDKWVTFVASNAFTVGLVSGRVALGKPPTGILD